MTSVDDLPDDAESLKRLLLAREEELVSVTAEAATLRAKAAGDQALIAHLKLQIEKLKRDRFGQRSERSARLLDQLELQLEELESSATEDELAAEVAVARTTSVAAFTRKRPSRQPFPEHLQRERVIVPGPTACPCCGGGMHCIGELRTEQLDVAPVQLRVRVTRRPRYACRACEGAIVVAEVVLTAEPADPGAVKREILDACRQELAPFKVPAMLGFVPALALSAGGKLERAVA